MDWNGFKGAAKRLDDIDLPREGAAIGVGEDVLHGFIEVESRGRGFDDQGRPLILYEPHVAYRCSAGAKRDALVKAGLAYPTQGTKPYGAESAQYPKLLKAIAIDETAALKACSWGMFQVLGENHAMIGFATVQAMVQAMMADEENHLRACIAFVKAAAIDDDLRRLDAALKTRAVTADECRVPVRVYNGPKYEKNGYHTKFAAALNKWRKIPDTPWSPDAPAKPAKPSNQAPAEPAVSYDRWKRGVAYDELKNAQTLLQAAGYYLQGEVDGKWGVLTRDSLLAFKAGKGLPRTDEIDEATLAALMTAKPRELPPERSQATVEQVAPKSEIIPAAQGVQTDAKKGGFLQMIGGAFAMLFGGGTATKLLNEDPGSVQQTAENARWLREYFPDLPISFWLFLAVAIVFVWPHAVAWWSARKASKIVDLKVEEYRTGGRA